MKHIDKIKVERSYNAEDKFFNEIVPILDQIYEADHYVHFMDREVHPYGHPIPFRIIYKNMRQFFRFTRSSQDILIAEMNGCIDILNHEIGLYCEPDVQIRYLEGNKKGQVGTLKSSIAKSFVECAFVEYV